MFENFSTRDCNKCIHHISGNCTKWDCEMETLEHFKQRVQAETKAEILQIIREGEPTEDDDLDGRDISIVGIDLDEDSDE